MKSVMIKNDMQEVKQEDNLFMYHNLEDQPWPVMPQDVSSWADFLMDEGLWGGLWNLDDQVDHSSNCSKVAKQIQNNYYGDCNI